MKQFGGMRPPASGAPDPVLFMFDAFGQAIPNGTASCGFYGAEQRWDNALAEIPISSTRRTKKTIVRRGLITNEPVRIPAHSLRFDFHLSGKPSLDIDSVQTVLFDR